MSDSNLEILSYESTPLGTLCLRRRELLSQPGVVVTEVTLNHEFLMSSLYTDSEEALSRIAIEMHVESLPDQDTLQILIGGLGLGYTTRQALLPDRFVQIEVVELLPQVIDWLKQGLVPLSPELLPELDRAIEREARLTITQGDVYQRLAAEPKQLFDIILIDVDHSPDDRLDNGTSISFYSRSGLESAKKHLAPNGILGVWSYAESSPFADSLHSVFPKVRIEPITHNNELINEQHTDWLFFAQN